MTHLSLFTLFFHPPSAPLSLAFIGLVHMLFPLPWHSPSFHSSSFHSPFRTQPTCHPLFWSPGDWTSLPGISRPSSAKRCRIIMSLYVSTLPLEWGLTSFPCLAQECVEHAHSLTHSTNALWVPITCQDPNKLSLWSPTSKMAPNVLLSNIHALV